MPYLRGKWEFDADYSVSKSMCKFLVGDEYHTHTLISSCLSSCLSDALMRSTCLLLKYYSNICKAAALKLEEII